MKRREFLIASASAGLAGATLANVARGAVPCPPSTLSVEGGTSASTNCSASADGDADWLARSTAAGVMWATDFRTDAEVSRFVIDEGYFNQPGRITRVTTDGISGGGCLQINTPSGEHTQVRWARPFSALPGDRGYVSGPDISSNYKSDGSWKYWTRGYYGHSTYHAGGGQWDGTEFYLQARVKLSPSTLNSGNPDTGKLVYIDAPGGNDCELIQQVPYYNSTRFNIYTNFGRSVNNPMLPPSNWTFPLDEWVTLMWHVRPGTEGNANSLIEAWVARAGQTTFTKVWDAQNAVLYWSPTSDSPNYNGYNVFMISNYMNGAAANGGGFWRRWDQIILSKQPIACPRT